MRRLIRPAGGFTLIEMIMVMVITGILAGMVATFIRAPVEGYVDSVRRAELTDTADAALRRIVRDVRLALPNSLRATTSGGVVYVEFIMTASGGRYRDEADGSTGGDFLSFTDAGDTTFDVLGPLPTMAENDFIVVYNLGIPGEDAYAGYNVARIADIDGSTVTLAANPFAAQPLPQPSPAARFQVVPGGVQAVTYVCPQLIPGDLRRRWGYGFNASQVAPPVGGTTAMLAAGATCAVDYLAAATGRHGLLSIRLTLAGASGEAVTLFQQIHVDNAP